MRALFIQHEPDVGPGLVGTAVQGRGYDIDTLRLSATSSGARWEGTQPDPTDYDLVIPLGATWAVYDRAQVGAWIDTELDLLRAADAGGVPVLGICFGGQALAAAHGGRVERAPVPEIGWTMIESDDAALVPPGPWMQWHFDRFSVPPGATEIARNSVGSQAFRLRRNLALQFHPEVDEHLLEMWVATGGEEAQQSLAAAGTDLDTLVAGARCHRPRVLHDVERLLDTVLSIR